MFLVPSHRLHTGFSGHYSPPNMISYWPTKLYVAHPWPLDVYLFQQMDICYKNLKWPCLICWDKFCKHPESFRSLCSVSGARPVTARSNVTKQYFWVELCYSDTEETLVDEDQEFHHNSTHPQVRVWSVGLRRGAWACGILMKKSIFQGPGSFPNLGPWHGHFLLL